MNEFVEQMRNATEFLLKKRDMGVKGCNEFTAWSSLSWSQTLGEPQGDRAKAGSHREELVCFPVCSVAVSLLSKLAHCLSHHKAAL